MTRPRRRAMSAEERFWQKVRKSAGCWEWQAYRNAGGYGTFNLDGSIWLAHRVSFEWANGAIPNGLEVDHMCHNPACVNPTHLRLATSALNGQNLSGARRDSSTGLRGVDRIKGTGKWRARVRIDGKQKHLGCFDSSEEAAAAAAEWRRTHMPYSLMDKEKEDDLPC